MKRTYLVTGGTGFIGSAVVEALVRRGDKVRCFDNQWRGTPENLREIASSVDFRTGDIRDFDAVKKASDGVDCIMHLAAINGTEHFYTIPEQILEVSVKGMMNVLDACKANGIDDMVLMSSSEVYQTPPTIPTPEDVPLSVPDVHNARYSYGGGKIISELLAVNYGKRVVENIRIVRPHNVYGPKMGYEHVVPQFIGRMQELSAQSKNTASKTLELPIQGTGKETRSFVFIDDMVQGFLIAADKGEANGVYHVGTMEEITVEHLAKEIGRCFGKTVTVKAGKLQKGGTMRRCPDTTKIQKLGYRPKVSLEDGLKKTVDWYVKHPKVSKTEIQKEKAA